MVRQCTLRLALAATALLGIGQSVAQNPPRFGEPVPAMQDSVQREALKLSTATPPRSLASGAEVILISGYEPSNRRQAGTAVRVVVDRPQSKVLLVLTSYEKVAWQIEVTPGTKLSGIVVGGYKPSYVFTKAATEAYLAKLPYAHETNNVNFRNLLAQLDAWFGISKVDVFRGSYTIPSLVKISTLDQPSPEMAATGPLPQKPPVDYTFELLDTMQIPTKWSLSGPIGTPAAAYPSTGGLAISRIDGTQYRLKQDGLHMQRRDSSAPATVLELPPNFPPFSWAMDVAYDTKRDIVTVVSLGGEGFLYRYDAKHGKWLDFRSLNNIDIYALAYDEKEDRYVAWTDNGMLLFISGMGELLFSRQVGNRLPGFGRVFDRGNGRPPRLTLVPSGKDIALIFVGGKTVRNIWHYDVLGDKLTLTYLTEPQLAPSRTRP